MFIGFSSVYLKNMCVCVCVCVCMSVLMYVVPGGNVISRHKLSTELSYGTEGQGYFNIHQKSSCVRVFIKLTEDWSSDP